MTILYLFVYGLLVGGTVLGGFFLHLRKSQRKAGNSTISSSQITVLIPFRDEELRIHVLLDSLLSLDKFPNKFLFIDDHSTDNTVLLIREKLVNVPFEVLSLNQEYSGKKAALRAGIAQVETSYILTFDADVSVPPNYFNAIELLDEADMYVLPAILTAKKTLHFFYELDVVLANALNTGLAGIARPIFASGANLLYKKEVFDEVDDLPSHAHNASGDDTYLLRDFRKNGKDVRLESRLDVAIFTETPQSFRQFIDQRLRWVGKTTDIGDQLATFAALGQFILALGFFSGLVYWLIQGDLQWFLILFSFKIGMDLVFFLPFFIRTKRPVTWLLIPIYELLFPIYSITLGVLMLGYRPKWKGRPIQSNNS